MSRRSRARPVATGRTRSKSERDVIAAAEQRSDVNAVCIFLTGNALGTYKQSRERENRPGRKWIMVESIHADRGVSRVARTPASRRPPPPPAPLPRHSHRALAPPLVVRVSRSCARLVPVETMFASTSATPTRVVAPASPAPLRRAPSSLLVASRRAASPRPPPSFAPPSRSPAARPPRAPPPATARRRSSSAAASAASAWRPARARRLRRHDPREERGHGRACRGERFGTDAAGYRFGHRPLPDAPPGPLPRAVHRGRQEPARLHGHSARGPRVQGAFSATTRRSTCSTTRSACAASRRSSRRRRRAVHRLARARARASATASRRSSRRTRTRSSISSTSDASAPRARGEPS